METYSLSFKNNILNSKIFRILAMLKYHKMDLAFAFIISAISLGMGIFYIWLNAPLRLVLGPIPMLGGVSFAWMIVIPIFKDSWTHLVNQPYYDAINLAIKKDKQIQLMEREITQFFVLYPNPTREQEDKLDYITEIYNARKKLIANEVKASLRVLVDSPKAMHL